MKSVRGKRRVVQYRCPPGRAGRIRRSTLGAYGESPTPDQARSIAVQVKGELAQGIDPVTQRALRHAGALRATQKQKRTTAPSVAAIATTFIERHAKPCPRRWREYERRLRDDVLPAWGSRPTTEIQRSEVTPSSM
ncbi:integrase arm-type DNA-binding domain-containing protein [Microvirga sp. M2]|uniref:integrase arm-type DNA-binding domain-containing protein n=1 Tax=Microvirga sp. M2 TaxID=3073270 RepID=UPI0039C008E8